LVVITRTGYEVTDFHGEPAKAKPFRVSWDLSAAEKGGHDYFMLKEIEEQPAAIADTLRAHFDSGRVVLDEQRLIDQDLRDVDKVFVIACGSAYHSGLVAKYAIEHWTRLPVEVELASEFRYRDPVLDRDTLVVAVSQSGETADTLEAVRPANRRPGSWPSATPTAPRSPASPTPCCTPTPAPRSAWRPRRPSWPK
jgi:glutamine---fructose-6-phosphate transaminase (isomerizing)